MVMRMEYFKKIQCYKPSTGIIDAPISIEEVALLQDSVDKNMLGRIKFINYSKGTIVAIFVRLRAANIAGEPISLDKERFIYQDMKISSGELYGNKIPISLPADARYFSVQLEKVVFDDGEIWDATNGVTCKISQKQIQVPEEVIDSVREELQKHLNNVEYVRYFYEENQDFWECTCGRINSSDNEVCPFCNNSNVSQKRYFTQEKVSKIIAEKEEELQREQERQQQEKEKMLRAKREYEEKMARQEQEERERLEQIRQENLRLEEIRKKKRKKNIIFVICLSVIGIIIAISSYMVYHYRKAEKYADSGEYIKEIEEWKAINWFSNYEDRITKANENILNNKKQQLIEEYPSLENEDILSILCCLGQNYDFIIKYSDIDFIEKVKHPYLQAYGDHYYRFKASYAGKEHNMACLFNENNICIGIGFLYNEGKSAYEEQHKKAVKSIGKILGYKYNIDKSCKYDWAIYDDHIWYNELSELEGYYTAYCSDRSWDIHIFFNYAMDSPLINYFGEENDYRK